ncbi:EAL domain-containing protein (plasmid) [Stutzerimonas degradans]|nr:EAL domain-containing protein [Stutzerimonas degradans]
MLKIAHQTIHSSDGLAVATEVLARLQFGDAVFTPPHFMAGKSRAAWFALDIEVLRMLRASSTLVNSPLVVFMNISASTLDTCAYFHIFHAKLMALDPAILNRLVIEIPESSSLRGDELVARLIAIKSTGAKVAIDDFGQAHANQERLETFDWDFCKIDLPAIQTTENLNWVDVAIKHCTANSTHLIMEKIESVHDIDHLLLPVKHSAWYQGYCFSRPEAVDLMIPVAGSGSATTRRSNHAWG